MLLFNQTEGLNKEIVIDFFKTYESDYRGKKDKYTFKKTINGIEFKITKVKGYSGEFKIGETSYDGVLELFRYDEFWDSFDKEIYPDIESSYNSELENKDKINLSVYDIRDIVKSFLKNKNIEYNMIQANTGTIYIETSKGKIRISDHTGKYRNTDDVSIFLFDGKYEKGEIEKKVNSIL